MPLFLTVFLILASQGLAIRDIFVDGFIHIIPHGADHILFLLALFFLSKKPTELVLQLTLFTLAHSLTLGLSFHGLISLPEKLVETAIAMSIVFVAVENMHRKTLSSWLPYVVFVSGMVHGLGFAHTFPSSRLGDTDFLTALVSFNMGLQFGQLAVVGLAYAAVAAWWGHARYRSHVAKPASALIALLGLFWVVERALL